MTDDTDNSDDTQSSDDQFTDGETIVECHAGGRPGTGKTTRLIEWFRAQHGDETVLTLIDPKGDPASDSSTQEVAVSRSNPLTAAPRHGNHKYRVAGERHAVSDETEERP